MEPQSIVHQLIRLERNVVKSISAKIKRKSKKTISSSFKKDIEKNSTITIIPKASEHTTKTYSTEECNLFPSDDKSSIPSIFSINTYADFDDKGECITDEEEEVETAFYRSIDQNEVFAECFGSRQDDPCCIIHFSSEGSLQSAQVDEELSHLSTRYSATYKFLRIRGTGAPFITSKLGITKFPTVVAIRNGSTLARFSNFDNDEACFVGEWIGHTK